jgi:hypothetical protein
MQRAERVAPKDLSRRDGAIVAWHEVPGKALSQESRPVGYGLIRAGERTDSSDWRIGVTSTYETLKFVLYYLYLAFLKKHGTHFDENYLWGLAAPIIPYPTGRFFRGDAFQALRARLRSESSLRDAAPSASGRKFPDVTFCKCPNSRPRVNAG